VRTDSCIPVHSLYIQSMFNQAAAAGMRAYLRGVPAFLLVRQTTHRIGYWVTSVRQADAAQSRRSLRASVIPPKRWRCPYNGKHIRLRAAVSTRLQPRMLSTCS